MGFFSNKCPNCGGKVRRGASFCPHCGQAAPKAKLACPSCGAEIRAESKFCPKCGAPVTPPTGEAPPVDKLNRWKRDPLEFARRIEAADLRGMLKRGLVIEPGTQALIFQGGRLVTTASAGTYNLNEPLGDVDVSAPATAILMDAGDVTLHIAYTELRTAEDVEVAGGIEVAVRLSAPQAVFENLMHGRESLPIEALARLLSSESANLVQARIKQTSVKDLRGNLDLKSAIEADLREGVSASLARSGLELVRLRVVEFSEGAYADVRGEAGAVFVEEEKAGVAERRAQLNTRLRELLTRERMEKFSSEKDLEEFVRQTEHELGMKDVVRAAEMEDLKRTYADKRQDAEIARKHLLEKLDLEHQLVVQRIQWSGEAEELDHKVQQRRKALAAHQEAEWEQAKGRQRLAELERQEREADEESKLRITKEKARLGAELRKQKVALDDEEERLRIERQRAEAEVGQEIADREFQREMEKLKALSAVEQARLAADLKKTESMKDMTEQQIMALMAEKSPHVAAAIAERYKAEAQAGASAEVKALYEKILAGKEAEADRIERVMDKALGSVERVAGAGAERERQQKEEVKDTAEKAMDRMADVAAARAGASGAADERAAKLLCPKCKHQVPAGSKFCDNCGHQFFD